MSDTLSPDDKLLTSLPIPSEQLKLFMSSTSQNNAVPDTEDSGQESDEIEYIEHIVDHKKDTIIGLALSYGVAKKDIIMYNDLPSSGNLTTINLVKIPMKRVIPFQKQEPPPKLFTEQVKIRTFIKEHGVSEGEAKYYLNECDGKYSDAVKMYLGEVRNIPLSSSFEKSASQKLKSFQIERGDDDMQETTTLLQSNENSSVKTGRSTSVLRKRNTFF